MNQRALSLALAALAGMAAWVSLGALAVTDAETRARVGLLPPWWMLAAFEVAFVGAVAVRRWPLARLWPLSLLGFVMLPWLPGPIPAAFLIWYGPAAWAVWGAVVVGLLSPWLTSAARLAMPPGRAPWLAALAAVAAYALGAAALQPRIPSGDEPHYLVIAQSLLLDGDLRIEDNHRRGDYFAYSRVELPPDFLRRGLDGEIYSIHAPGVAVLVAPGFAVAGYPGAVATVVAVAALGLALLWAAAWRLTDSSGAAWLAVVAFGATSPGFFHAFTIFPDGAGAACTIAALALLVRLERAEAVSSGAVMAAGAALALLPWLHTRFAIIAGLLGLALVLRLKPRGPRAVVAFLSVPLVAALAWFGFFWWIWGTPNPSAPYGGYTQSAVGQVPAGLAGLLFDQQFGLVPNAPVYALAPFGWLALVRVRPRLAAELTVLLGVYGAVVASYTMWWGGHSAPARFLVAVLPVLALLLAAAWQHGRQGQRALLLACLTVSLGLVAVRVLVEHGALLFNVRDGYDLLLGWANRSVDLTLAVPSRHRDTLAAVMVDSLLWMASGLGWGATAVWLIHRRGHAWTMAVAAVGLTVMTASTLVWQRHEHAVTPSTSALALWERWPVDARAIGWTSSPPQLTAADSIPAALRVTSSTRGPRPRGEAPLLSVPGVPAGSYEIDIEPESPRGQLSLQVGDQTPSLESFELDGSAGRAGLRFVTPVRLQALTITGDDHARRSIARLTLRPETVAVPRSSPGVARRATSYGDIRAFFLDDDAFMETPGFWTRGDAHTTVVVDRRHPHALVAPAPVSWRVRAGAAAVTVAMASGRWREQVRLAAGEDRIVTLPDDPEGDGWVLRVTTEGGFRPAAHDPGSSDQRRLGAWFERVF